MSFVAGGPTPEHEPWASSPAVRSVMKGNRKRDTAPELAIRRAIHRAGLRYRVARSPFTGVGTADLVFTRARVAVFVDGCFWHGCPTHFTFPRVNPDYWRGKIEGNKNRDARNDEVLAEAGWLSVRLWEHEDPAEAAARVAKAVRDRGSDS